PSFHPFLSYFSFPYRYEIYLVQDTSLGSYPFPAKSYSFPSVSYPHSFSSFDSSFSSLQNISIWSILLPAFSFRYRAKVKPNLNGLQQLPKIHIAYLQEW